MDTAYPRTMKHCKQCGQPFRVRPSHYDKKAYCSEACMALDYRTRLAGQANPNYRDGGVKLCEHCGGTYTSHARSRKYCSHACALTAQREERERRRPPKPMMPPPPPTQLTLPLPRDRVCERCGASFPSAKFAKWCPACRYDEMPCVVCGTVFRVRREQIRKTCGQGCARRYKSERQRGVKSHLWQGGKTKAATLFRDSLDYGDWRNAVFSRDEYTCQLCGKRGGRLCAHHIIRFSIRRDLALEVWNGITLCWPCHAHIRHHESEYAERFFAITGGEG